MVKDIPSEKAPQGEQNGPNFSFVVFLLSCVERAHDNIVQLCITLLTRNDNVVPLYSRQLAPVDATNL